MFYRNAEKPKNLHFLPFRVSFVATLLLSLFFCIMNFSVPLALLYKHHVNNFKRVVCENADDCHFQLIAKSCRPDVMKFSAISGIWNF